MMRTGAAESFQKLQQQLLGKEQASACFFLRADQRRWRPNLSLRA
jgi:hypothetical protein